VGQIDVFVRITRPASSGRLAVLTSLRDTIRNRAEGGTYQARFQLWAGSYVCSVLVVDDATGQRYGETIAFEVK
jgi:hypothetical protein